MKFELRSDKEPLIRKRGWRCEYCHARLATDLHHCLIRRDKRFPQLDVEENFMCVCHECHMSGIVDTAEVRDAFWITQCERYGETHMQEWLDHLPLKIKPRFINATEAPTPLSVTVHL